jgi:hypothetical protein
MYPVATLFGGLGRITPVVVRIVFGTMMAAHGWDKIQGGPTGFGEFLGSELGHPAGVALGWFVTMLEFVGGIMLVVGFLDGAALLPMRSRAGSRSSSCSWRPAASRCRTTPLSTTGRG